MSLEEKSRERTPREGHVKTQAFGVSVYRPGMPKIASSHRILGERRGKDTLSEPPKETNPDNTFISTSDLQNCETVKILLL